MNALTSILQYNGSRGKWQVTRGSTVVDFPKGPEGKKSAQSLILKTEAPLVFEMLEQLIEKHPDNRDLITRAWKAALLSCQHYVLTPYTGQDHELARVASASEPIEYHISSNPIWEETVYKCNCPDWQHGRARLGMSPDDPDYPKYGAPVLDRAGIVCKHVLAYIFTTTANITLVEHSPTSFKIANAIWRNTINNLQKYLPDSKVILSDTKAVQMKDGQITISTNSMNISKWLDENFRARVVEEINANSDYPYPLTLNVQGV